MAIVFCLDYMGGFTAGDTATQITSYAYPTSTHATAAKKHPEKVAAEMIANESANLRGLPHVEDYDARNWLRLVHS